MTGNQTRVVWLAAIGLSLTLWLLLALAVVTVLTSPDVQLRNLAAMALACLAGTIAMAWWAWREG